MKLLIFKNTGKRNNETVMFNLDNIKYIHNSDKSIIVNSDRFGSIAFNFETEELTQENLRKITDDLLANKNKIEIEHNDDYVIERILNGDDA